MLEMYFVKPETVDHVRGCWLGPQIEAYVTWLSEHGYRPRTVFRRVPLLVTFAQFARDAGAQRVEDLPAHVEDFVAEQETKRQRRRGVPPSDAAKEFRGPIEQMLTVALADYEGSGRRGRADPFGEAAPGFFEYLMAERVCSRPRSTATATTWPASRTTWLASASRTWPSCRRRS